jgi:hypothetical protein
MAQFEASVGWDTGFDMMVTDQYKLFPTREEANEWVAQMLSGLDGNEMGYDAGQVVEVAYVNSVII